ncbi:MAG TPA: aconitate hydratase B, partial [Gammaproteobacteria bacterium]|nr:aconitate hydratase B [Gammaproteobacteria bacterium]
MLEEYRNHVEERAAEGIVPKPLNADQVAGLVELLKNPPAGEDAFLLDLLTNRIPAGVDEAAYVKAAFLTDVAKGETACTLISRVEATRLLGTMLGGYNIPPLVDLLDDSEVGPTAADALKQTLLMFDAFHDVEDKRQAGNVLAQEVMEAWAHGDWFTNKPDVPAEIKVTVYKVPGETNTDDLSPAVDAWSRPDIPLHAQAMLKARMDNPLETIEALKDKGHPIAYVGDVVGTGSSRKSATNSVLWHMGHDIPFVPNKRSGGVCIGGKIAPIFFNTMEDAGALPIECDVTQMNTGDV